MQHVRRPTLCTRSRCRIVSKYSMFVSNVVFYVGVADACSSLWCAVADACVSSLCMVLALYLIKPYLLYNLSYGAIC